MSAMDKFLNFMRLDPDDMDDDYDDDDYEVDDEPVEKPVKRIKKEHEQVSRPTPVERKQPVANKVTPMRPAKRSAANGMEVCVIKPTSIEDAREITETLLSNRTVVLNVEGLDVDIAQRIIDFTSGSCFAISGNLQKITNYIFIITPAAVDISGDFLGMLDGLSSNPLS